VIGGLVSSTSLTLVLLPTLYAWIGPRTQPKAS
jgi:Cu/Ag efflux pump CusA